MTYDCGFSIAAAGVYAFFGIVVGALTSAYFDFLKKRHPNFLGFLAGLIWPVFLAYLMLKK